MRRNTICDWHPLLHYRGQGPIAMITEPLCRASEISRETSLTPQDTCMRMRCFDDRFGQSAVTKRVRIRALNHQAKEFPVRLICKYMITSTVAFLSRPSTTRLRLALAMHKSRCALAL